VSQNAYIKEEELMRKVVLIVVVLLLAITVVPAFADDGEPVSKGPLHCPPSAPFGEPLRGAPSQGQGAGGKAGGTRAHPPAPQAGEGSNTGDGNAKICAPTGRDLDEPPRDDPREP